MRCIAKTYLLTGLLTLLALGLTACAEDAPVEDPPAPDVTEETVEDVLPETTKAEKAAEESGKDGE